MVWPLFPQRYVLLMFWFATHKTNWSTCLTKSLQMCSSYQTQLDQLERLRPEDTRARRLMITHTIESYWIPSQKKTKSTLHMFKEFAKISNFSILKQSLHATHLQTLLDKMCKYEMDPTSIVEDTEQTRFCPQRRTRWNQYTPLSTSLKQGYNKLSFKYLDTIRSPEYDI